MHNKLSTEPYTSRLASRWSNDSNELYFARRAIASLTDHYNKLDEEYEAYKKQSMSIPLVVMLINHLFGNSKQVK